MGSTDTWAARLYQCQNHAECQDDCSHKDPHDRQSLHGYYCYEDDWMCAGFLCRPVKEPDGTSS
jgi:hypothetical protein